MNADHLVDPRSMSADPLGYLGSTEGDRKRRRLRREPAWGPRPAVSVSVPDRAIPAWASRYETRAFHGLP